MSVAVEAQALHKQFGQTTACQDISFAVEEEEIFGFIGPDGAGKTTLFRMLATLLVPDHGTARILGRDVVKEMWKLRPLLGYMPGRFSLYPDLSVEENLQFFASVFGTTIQAEYERIAPIYRQLEPFRTRRARALSGGMKQKLALSCALVHRPQVLLLDEPTTGVDAVSRREFWDLLGELRTSGLTIVVSTPYMDEATRCDRVALISGGKILATDTPAAITSDYDRPLLAITAVDRYATLLALREAPNVFSVYPFGETLHYSDLRLDVSTEALTAELSAFLRRREIEGEVAPIPATIEDVFMERLR